MRRSLLAAALATALGALAAPFAPPLAAQTPSPGPTPSGDPSLVAGDPRSVAGDPRSLVAGGDQSRFAEDWYSAIDDYVAALALNPSYAQAYEGLAECYYELGEYDQALSYVQKATPFLKGDASLADLEGFVRVGLGDLDGARRAFAAVSARLPNDLDARFGLSLLDLAAGKKTDARDRLEADLRVAPRDARVLLSLALIASDQGRDADAQSLVETALRYHGSEPRTQFVAASLAAASGDYGTAAFRARNALDLKPGYPEARLLLGSLLYGARSYDQAIAIMREAVARNRKDGMAWYTLGMAQEGAGKHADAIYSLKTAVSLRPDDEMARLALEFVVRDSTGAEDQSRGPYADWHVFRGKELEDRSFYDQAIFEYRRALSIYPYDKQARQSYALMLKSKGFPGKYLSELEFLKDNGLADQGALDSIEAYGSLLSSSLGRRWSVDEEALTKRPYKIILAYVDKPVNGPHVAGQDLALRYLQDILASSSRAEAVPAPLAEASFAEAFKAARDSDADYFVLVSVKEDERDIEIDADMRVGRTGSPAASFKSFRTGNDRLKLSAARTADLIVSSLPPLGALVKRSQDKVLVDLGKSDGLRPEALAGAGAGASGGPGIRLAVVKKGSVQPKPEGLGLVYPPAALLGEVTLSAVGEEVSEGTLKSSGFFDTVNIGDQVVLAPAPAAGTTTAAGTSGSATAVPAAPGAQPPALPLAEPQKEWPGLFTAVRALR